MSRFQGGIIGSVVNITSGTAYTGKANGIFTLSQQIIAKSSAVWPKGLTIPSNPIIGTVTAGDALAYVPFTAPSDTGGSAITSYTAISSPGGITATSSTSPITVTGLTNATSYTFTVKATNICGSSISSSVSNTVTPKSIPTTIGQSWGGGYYTGIIVISGVQYYLIVSPKSTGQNSSKQYKTSRTADTGTTSVNDGYTNSNNMNDAAHPAAQFCRGLNINGYTDWYLPSRDELELCYRNLKPTTTQNTVYANRSAQWTGNGSDSSGNGTNTNSSPTGGAYTTSNPAQTSVTLFKTGNSEAFDSSGQHWASTEFDSAVGWVQWFDNGGQYGYNLGVYKDGSIYVRAVRKVAV